ncbi:MAG: hypothetical protein KAG66_10170 [Methylococcales bacterium]|nr:hypothetical protein [Methylococcales bacterium]
MIINVSAIGDKPSLTINVTGTLNTNYVQSKLTDIDVIRTDKVIGLAKKTTYDVVSTTISGSAMYDGWLVNAHSATNAVWTLPTASEMNAVSGSRHVDVDSFYAITLSNLSPTKGLTVRQSADITFPGTQSVLYIQPQCSQQVVLYRDTLTTYKVYGMGNPVDKDLELSGLTVSAEITSSDVIVKNSLVSESKTDLQTSVSIGHSLDIAGTKQTGNILSVHGASVFDKHIQAASTLTVEDTIVAKKNITISGIGIRGCSLSVLGAANVSTNLTIGDTLAVGGNLVAGDAFSVMGETTLDGEVHISDDLTVDTTVRVAGIGVKGNALVVVGNSVFGSIKTSGAAVLNKVAVDTTLSVSGVTTLANSELISSKYNIASSSAKGARPAIMKSFAGGMPSLAEKLSPTVLRYGICMKSVDGVTKVTLPTAADIVAAISPILVVGDSWEFVAVNATTQAFTILESKGVSIIGNAIVGSKSSAKCMVYCDAVKSFQIIML